MLKHSLRPVTRVGRDKQQVDTSAPTTDAIEKLTRAPRLGGWAQRASVGGRQTPRLLSDKGSQLWSSTAARRPGLARRRPASCSKPDGARRKPGVDRRKDTAADSNTGAGEGRSLESRPRFQCLRPPAPTRATTQERQRPWRSPKTRQFPLSWRFSFRDAFDALSSCLYVPRTGRDRTADRSPGKSQFRAPKYAPAFLFKGPEERYTSLLFFVSPSRGYPVFSSPFVP